MAGFDPLGWLGGVWSGGWIPGFQPTTPTNPAPKPQTMPQTPTTQAPQQPISPAIGMTQNAMTESQFMLQNPQGTPMKDPFGRPVQDNSYNEYMKYQSAMAQQQAQQQKIYADQQAQSNNLPEGLVSYRKSNVLPRELRISTTGPGIKLPSFLAGQKYPSIEFRNPATVGKEVVSDIDMSFNKLFGYSQKGGYLSKTPDPLGAIRDTSTAVYRPTLGTVDITQSQAVRENVNANALKALLGVTYYIPPVRQYVDSPSGKKASETIGTAGMTIYEDIIRDPIGSYALYKVPTALKGLEYAGAGTIAKAATARSYPTISKLGRLASTPTAAELYSGAKLLALGGMTYMAAKEIQNAPNTPKDKGEAIGHVLAPVVLMTAGLPSAKAAFNKNHLKGSNINKGVFNFNANNPYKGTGYISGQYEKGVFGKSADKITSAYGELFNRPLWMPKNGKVSAKDQLRYSKIQSDLKPYEMPRPGQRFEGIDMKEEPLKRNWYGDLTQNTLREWDALGIASEKHVRIPGTKTYVPKKALIAGGILGGTAVGYLYSEPIMSGTKKVVDKANENRGLISIVGGGLLLGRTRLKTATEELSEKILDKNAYFDKNYWKWDKSSGMWRELTYDEKIAWDAKQLKLETTHTLKPRNEYQTSYKTNRVIPKEKLDEDKGLNLILTSMLKPQPLKNNNLNKNNNTNLNFEQKQNQNLKQNLKQNSAFDEIFEPPKTPKTPLTTISKFYGSSVGYGIIPPPQGTQDPQRKGQKKKKGAHWETGAAPTAPSVATFVFGLQKQTKPVRKSAKIDHRTSALDEVFGKPKQRRPAKIPISGIRTGGSKKLMTPKRQKVSKEVKATSSGLFTYRTG